MVAPLLRAPLPGHGNRTRIPYPWHCCMRAGATLVRLLASPFSLSESLLCQPSSDFVLHHSPATTASINQATNSPHKTVWFSSADSSSSTCHLYRFFLIDTVLTVLTELLECLGFVWRCVLFRDWWWGRGRWAGGDWGERKSRKREREWGFGFGSMGRGLVRGAIRGWKTSGSVCGNRTLTTCRAVILPRFGGPEVTPYSRGLYVELGSCDV